MTERAGRWPAGARLAMTTLTVLPLRAGRVDRHSAAVAMAGAPLVGLALGAVLAVAARVLTAAGLAPVPVAAVLVALLALLTRGLHLDGLADTFDGLGSYAPPERALAILKSPEAGPLGVSAIAVTLLVDAAALSALVARHGWLLIAVAVAVGRFGISLCCARPVPAARPDGLGALVAGTVPVPVCGAWALVLAVLAGLGGQLSPGSGWTDWLRGVLAVLLAGAAAGLLARQCVRRFGGVTGDVLGAACELATAVALLVLCAG
ncbi:adenosylcobinamide-GDP ribazoletransferase [Jatrophihabitans sp.]|uniref:adenosylcobinamide-GDP ribazoletransferase n=1 Tax=Jatrophihabitans sp. TaxID=1932789 RepID=UPI002BCEE64F|nr:adenosylcobinamide-GDP ribazoletransferase [Jatrophihabitans sp.]